MANVVKIVCENPDEILNAGAYGTGALIDLHTSATETGVFAAVTGTGSTPTIAVVAGTRIYTGYDPVGTSSSWYKTRFTNAGATRLSDWSTAFQVGAEEAGLICGLPDAKQRLGIPYTDTSEDENLLDFIRQITSFIEGPRTGRWFLPRPLSGTTTYRVHTNAGRVLRLPKGIRSITTLGIATEDQPSSGGTYTTATATDYYIDPPEMERDLGWPGMRIVFRRNASGPETQFYSASFGAEITGALGFATVPADITQIGLNLVVALHRRRGTSGGDAVTVNIDGSRTFEWLLSKTDRDTLDWYRNREMI